MVAVHLSRNRLKKAKVAVLGFEPGEAQRPALEAAVAELAAKGYLAKCEEHKHCQLLLGKEVAK